MSRKIGVMAERDTGNPSPPLFEFNPNLNGWAYVFDKPGHLSQEPPEFEERGPDHVFDSTGRSAELEIANYVVVIRGWSPRPDLETFDRYLRSAAANYLPNEDVRTLNTLQLRDRLDMVLRQRQREQMIYWPVVQLVQKFRNFVSRGKRGGSSPGDVALQDGAVIPPEPPDGR